MTSKEFVIWFSGYADAIQSTPTQHQWDELKKKVQSVGDPIPFPFGGMLEEPLIPSSGSSGTIIATPGYGSITYNPSTTRMYPSGSAWSYTDALGRYNNWYWTLPTPNQPTTGSNQLELDFEPK